jgi:hypothetical protein
MYRGAVKCVDEYNLPQMNSEKVFFWVYVNLVIKRFGGKGLNHRLLMKIIEMMKN